jgi:hypothetical protein
MIDKELEQITENDLQRLVTNKVAENRTLDYKEELPKHSDKEKKEFYKDVSSFANALGGDIIYGISEEKKTKIPKEVKGLDIESIDEEVTRLSSMISDGIEPRIIPIPKIQSVKLSNKKTVMIIRIYRSWTAPHRIGFDNHHRFWIRGNNSKHEMDITELRNAFNLSGNMEERIQKFRMDRMQKILANETPILLPSENSSFLILHLIPLASFHPDPRYFDIKKNKETLNKFMMPMSQESLNIPNSIWWKNRNNFDGFLTHQDNRDNDICFVQFFRNGVIESVRSGIVYSPQGIPVIYGGLIEDLLVQSITKYFNLLKQIGIQPPIFLFLTLTGVRNVVMYINIINHTRSSHTIKIDRDILQIPELVIENFDIPVEKLLKPAFDTIWNACGYDAP